MSNSLGYKFYNSQSDNWELIEPEVWSWEAHFSNGQTLSQFDHQTKTFHQFQEIDQSQLILFRMVSNLHSQSYSLIFDPKQMKLIHFYRNIVLNAASELQSKVKLYCFGYELKNKHKRSQKTIMVITPQNELIVTQNLELLDFQP